MRSHRLSRLSHLTHGAALVGLGLGVASAGTVGCGGKEPVINSVAPDTAPAASSAKPTSDPAPPEHVNAPAPPKHVNSPGPQEPPPAPVASGSASPAGSAAPKPPVHTNAPKKP